MIAITKQQLPTIEELMAILKKRLETLGKVEELETRALEAVALVISAYRQVELGVDFYEGFVNKMLEMFPSEIRSDYDELDSDLVTAQRDRITELEERILELESDIDGLMAANKELQTKNADLEIDNSAARAAHAQIEKVLLTDPVKQKLEETEKRLLQYHAKCKVGDRFQSESEGVATITWINEKSGEFNLKRDSGGNTVLFAKNLEKFGWQPVAKELEKPATELTYISTEVAYLRLTTGEVLSGYIGFKNGNGLDGQKLSSAKIRASKWMDYIYGLYGVKPEAMELRAAERLKGFDYEIKIMQGKHSGLILNILNPLSRSNFSVAPTKEQEPQKPEVEEISVPKFEFQPLELFDEDAPQYTVFHSGIALGKVFLSYGKNIWKISGDTQTEFSSKELAAEELVRRSIISEPQFSDAAF